MEVLSTKHTTSFDARTRKNLRLSGQVQGVGFRPFVYRLATELGLAGWVRNTPEGVTVEAEGPTLAMASFLARLVMDKPPLAIIDESIETDMPPSGVSAFEICSSAAGPEQTASILPDIATCRHCLSEIADVRNLRYRYPFTSCTDCGPRFSIVETLPYDRARTTMAGFDMCPRCLREYSDPYDRRFHAEISACPDCGPNLAFWNHAGEVLSTGDDALVQAGDKIRQGAIVAVKGLGGFHLMVDAGNANAVARLRERKARPHKPFATMFADLATVRRVCEVSVMERALLCSPQSPIVLLTRQNRADNSIAAMVAPDNPCLGVMLPTTPLHAILLGDLDYPVVATSGNRSDEPLCTDEREALVRLAGIADCYLVHDRPIHRGIDDSVLRVMSGTPCILRRARGYAPQPLDFGVNAAPILALGGHLKNTVARTDGRKLFISQHMGDLDTVEARRIFEDNTDHILSQHTPPLSVITCDQHPDYYSSEYARHTEMPVISVPHHLAHVLACMVDNSIEGPVLGVACDGGGLGDDGNIWGGEFLSVSGKDYRRVAHLRPFRLPGGDAAIREPRRAALGLLFEMWGTVTQSDERALAALGFPQTELAVLERMMIQGFNAPICSSVGRLFDAAAALVGFVNKTTFEGQAAMWLEYAINGLSDNDAYDFRLSEPESHNPTNAMVVDWAPGIYALLHDALSGRALSEISIQFHNMLANAIAEVAQRVGLDRICLTGGCFQNKYLLERTVQLLRENGFSPYFHCHLPPNDGGLAAGQALYAAQQLAEEGGECV